jgi:uncharacterized membrane protein
MNGLLPERKTRLDSLAISLLLGCCLLWGMQQVLIKVTLSEMPPVFQAWMRMLGAALLLLIWCRLRGIVWWHKDGTLRAGLLAGLLFAAEFVCIYVGMQYTGSSRLTVFLYTSPFWVALLVPLWARSERLHAGQWAGLALAFCAVVFALREGLMQAGGPDHRGDPKLEPDPGAGREAAALPGRRERRAAALSVAGPGRDLALGLQRLGLGGSRCTGFPGGLLQLSDLDVAARSLPGDPGQQLFLLHAAVHLALWRAVAG